MIDTKWKRDYSGNIILLWIRKIITSLFYYRGFRKIYPHKPMFAPKAVTFLEKKINNLQRVFEFGSGVSSLWFAGRVKEYKAVEHDSCWYDKVTGMLNIKKLTNAEIFLIPEEKNNDFYDWEKNWPYYSFLKRPPNKPEYKDYISRIDRYPDKYFDCIIIDGRERLGCLVHAVSKLAENGIIIFDDSGRDRYQEIFDLLADWHYKSFRFGLVQTTFFTRKKSNLNIS